jgi:hypothetical protein
MALSDRPFGLGRCGYAGVFSSRKRCGIGLQADACYAFDTNPVVHEIESKRLPRRFAFVSAPALERKGESMYRSLSICSVAIVFAACSSIPSEGDLANVPEKLKPVGESVALVVPAKGVQIYECRARADQPGNHAWAFVAPEADLFDATGKRIGRHYAGPNWESNDGSKIAGTLKESAPAPRADAIAWLLLAAKSVGPKGAFSDITSIQRVNTTGGVAPATGCSQNEVGTTVRVPYSADYYLLKRD